ncbi:F-box protein GID2-like [Aristolochia californica]|uniref:F-box protein GID2-like n=1 Tax=Aristolochia californica TaxID=171875 RepID=UPI0035E2C994
MKRSMAEEEEEAATVAGMSNKRRLCSGDGGGEELAGGEVAREDSGFQLDEDLLFEVLKHADAKSLATAACVCKQWYRTAQDERLWEMVCTRHWANIGCGNQQLRSVVLALGGFRRLHTHCLWPFLKPSSTGASVPAAAAPAVPAVPATAPTTPFAASLVPPKSSAHWGKDEMHLSLSLLSIRYYERMDLNKRGR